MLTHPGTDAAEFIELYDGGVGNTSLTGLVVVFYNGSMIYPMLRMIWMDIQPMQMDILFLAMLRFPVWIWCSRGNLLQNGQDAVALYAANGADFPNNTPVTTSNMIDAIVYDTDDPDDPGLLILLNSGQPQVNENGKFNMLIIHVRGYPMVQAVKEIQILIPKLIQRRVL